MSDLLTPPARYVQLTAGTVRVGQLAATDARHPFAPDGHTGTSCLACYGWTDDARHAFHQPLPIGGHRG
jgi:hypothetical protein